MIWRAWPAVSPLKSTKTTHRYSSEEKLHKCKMWITSRLGKEENNSEFSLFSAGAGLGSVLYLFLAMDVNSLKPKLRCTEKGFDSFRTSKRRKIGAV